MEADPSPPTTSAAPEAAASIQASTEKQKYPVMTLVCCAICIVVFVGLVTQPNRYSWDALETWGCYPAAKIRSGAFWAFITSTFVHLELWHVAFNVYWLYVLGSRLERVIGSWRWLAFYLSAAFVSSGAEFALSDSTGIGASGVVYAIFGFMWLTRNQHPSFQQVLKSRTGGWFIVWLLGCIAMTLAKVWEVGNAAHVTGLLFGAGIGAWSVWRERRVLLRWGFGALFLFSVLPVFWAPWSVDWASEAGMRAYEHGDYASAIKWYKRSLSLGQDKSWCWQNIALAYFAAGDKPQYEQTLKLLRQVDEKAADQVEQSVIKSQK